jgi:hypothetical protein
MIGDPTNDPMVCSSLRFQAVPAQVIPCNPSLHDFGFVKQSQALPHDVGFFFAWHRRTMKIISVIPTIPSALQVCQFIPFFC